jgi:hypothetical protein
MVALSRTPSRIAIFWSHVICTGSRLLGSGACARAAPAASHNQTHAPRTLVAHEIILSMALRSRVRSTLVTWCHQKPRREHLDDALHHAMAGGHGAAPVGRAVPIDVPVGPSGGNLPGSFAGVRNTGWNVTVLPRGAAVVATRTRRLPARSPMT